MDSHISLPLNKFAHQKAQYFKCYICSRVPCPDNALVIGNQIYCTQCHEKSHTLQVAIKLKQHSLLFYSIMQSLAWKCDCSWQGILLDLPSHSLCLHLEAICNLCGKYFQKRNSIDHTQSGCNKEYELCSFSRIGCTFVGQPGDVKKHSASALHAKAQIIPNVPIRFTTCVTGHVLKPMFNKKEFSVYTCDMCNELVPLNEYTFNCALCNWDCCEKCNLVSSEIYCTKNCRRQWCIEPTARILSA